MAIKSYVGNKYAGLSTDTKPVSGERDGANFFELDTRREYLFVSGAWHPTSGDITFTGAGNVTVTTNGTQRTISGAGLTGNISLNTIPMGDGFGGLVNSALTKGTTYYNLNSSFLAYNFLWGKTSVLLDVGYNGVEVTAHQFDIYSLWNGDPYQNKVVLDPTFVGDNHLITCGSGSGVLLANSGSMALAEDFVFGSGKAIGVYYDSSPVYGAKWREQWRYPALSNGSGSSSSGSTQIANVITGQGLADYAAVFTSPSGIGYSDLIRFGNGWFCQNTFTPYSRRINYGTYSMSATGNSNEITPIYAGIEGLHLVIPYEGNPYNNKFTIAEWPQEGEQLLLGWYSGSGVLLNSGAVEINGDFIFQSGSAIRLVWDSNKWHEQWRYPALSTGSTSTFSVSGISGTSGRLAVFNSSSTITDLEGLRVTTGNSVVIGSGASPSALALGSANGFLYLSSSTNKPTGTPTTYGATIPVSFSTSTSARGLFAYSNGEWRTVADRTSFEPHSHSNLVHPEVWVVNNSSASHGYNTMYTGGYFYGIPTGSNYYSSSVVATSGFRSGVNMSGVEDIIAVKTVVASGLGSGSVTAIGGQFASTLIDAKKSYRCSVWFKAENNISGSIRMTLNGDANNSFGMVQVNNGVTISAGSTSEMNLINYRTQTGLLLNRWYLAVGYVFHSGSTRTGTAYLGGIYDPLTSEKIYTNTREYRWGYGTSSVGQADFGAHSYQIESGHQCTHYFAAPRLEALDGREPSITQLLGTISRSTGSGSADTIWSRNTTSGTIEATATVSSGETAYNLRADNRSILTVSQKGVMMPRGAVQSAYATLVGTSINCQTGFYVKNISSGETYSFANLPDSGYISYLTLRLKNTTTGSVTPSFSGATFTASNSAITSGKYGEYTFAVWGDSVIHGVEQLGF